MKSEMGKYIVRISESDFIRLKNKQGNHEDSGNPTKLLTEEKDACSSYELDISSARTQTVIGCLRY